MSTRKKPKSRRTTDEYLSAARNMAKLVPGLRKYKRRKTLKPQEKAAIRRAEKKLHGGFNLIPVDKRTAKELKDLLWAPGVQAIQFKNISPDAVVRRIKKDIYITSNGRNWIYWKLPDTSVGTMETSREELEQMSEEYPEAFRETFDIERLEELAARAYEDTRVKSVHLWTKQGRVGEGFRTLKQFMQWLYQEYSHYKDTERWVIGIAFTLD